MRITFAVLVALLGSGLWVSLQPAMEWSIDPASKLIVLDKEELAYPKHPLLVKYANDFILGMQPKNVRWLIPLNEDFLVNAARAKACRVLRLRKSNGDRIGRAACDYFRLVGPMDLKAKPSVSPSTMPFILEGMRALLYDLDGNPKAGHARALGVAHSSWSEGGGVGNGGKGFARLSAFGRFATQQQVINALANQMLLTAFLDDDVAGDAIRARKILKPVIIVGPPRTGTTFLHRALAMHPEVRFLPYYEALESVAPPSLAGDKIGVGEHDNRVGNTDEAMGAIHLLRPLFDRMMVMGAQVPFEDMQLSGHCFSSQLWEASVGYTPTYSKWYRQRDQQFGYRCIKLFLKLIDFQRNTTTSSPHSWVLKTPQHSANLPAIKAVFPDAVVVLTSRDPVNVLRSLLPLLSYALGVQNDRVDLHPFGAAWVTRLYSMMTSQKKNAPLFPKAIKTAFEDFTSSANATMQLVEDICKQAGLSTAEEALNPIRVFVEGERIAKVGGSRKTFKYDLEVFGIDEATVAQQFASVV